jgi:hypothetical protein
MSTLIDMKAWRARYAPEPLALLDDADAPVYSCIGCGSKLFRILETGQARCARCCAEMAPRPTVAAANRNSIPRWIPVVSLFALLIVVGTYFVVGQVV